MAEAQEQEGQEAEAGEAVEEELLAGLWRVAAAADGGERAEVERHLPGGDGAGAVDVGPGIDGQEVLEEGPRHFREEVEDGGDVLVVGQGVGGEVFDDEDAGEHGGDGGEGFVEAETPPAGEEEAGEGEDGGLARDGEGEHEQGGEQNVAAAQEEQEEAEEGAVEDVGED